MSAVLPKCIHLTTFEPRDQHALVYWVEIFDCAGNCSTEADDCGFVLLLKLPARTLNTAAKSA
jgi:hypothetical protein